MEIFTENRRSFQQNLKNKTKAETKIRGCKTIAISKLLFSNDMNVDWKTKKNRMNWIEVS